MKGSAKNVIVLSVITIIAGFLLGFVYDITKEPIEKMQYETKMNAYKTVFPEAASFNDFDMSAIPAEQILAENGLAAARIDETCEAVDASGNVCGYVFSVTDSEGYGGDITSTVGIRNDGCVLGVEILSISETAGLGMNAQKPEFLSQFTQKAVTQFAYTKAGAKADYEIDALSGATITTNAFVNSVNAALVYFRAVSGGAK